MNSYTLQIIGLSELENPLEIGRSYQMQIQADCVSITKTSEENGEFTFKHKIKQTIAEITSETGETIKTKDKAKQSVKLAAQIRILAEQENKDPDSEYQKYMILLRHYWPVIKQYLDTLNI